VRAALAALLLATPLAAQVTHRGVGAQGRVTQTVSYVDAWEEAGAGPLRDGTQDVLCVRELENAGTLDRTVQLVLYGAWGHHLYAYQEELVTPGLPDSLHLRTLRRALDLDGDGVKEIVLLERSVLSRLPADDAAACLADDEPGPCFSDAKVAIRYLSRKDGSLVEHDLEAEASSAAMKELLQAELGGAVNAWIQLAAADVDFVRERYEQARYRYGVVREWAESQLTGRDILALSPALAIPAATPDDPPVLWLAATRRIGALPRWYQKR
jgi:hypothetical protein